MNRHPLRVAIIADYAEEGWPSMDLGAEMLVTHLAGEHAGAIEPHLVGPPMRRRLTRFESLAHRRRPLGVVPLAPRLWDYPRALARLAGGFDVSHIVDHSYA